MVLMDNQPPKASAILYVTSVVMGFFGVMMPLLDMMHRSAGMMTDTLIELWVWNPWSEWGIILIILGLCHFLLGLMTDRRGA